MTKRFNVHVEVHLDYEVEVDTEADAIDEGWRWEDHRGHSSIDFIGVTQLDDNNEMENDDE